MLNVTNGTSFCKRVLTQARIVQFFLVYLLHALLLKVIRVLHAMLQTQYTTISTLIITYYNKTCLKRKAIVPIFFFRFYRFPFYKGLCFNKTKYNKYDRLGLQWRNNLK
jgi:hypothetical protein